MTDSEMELLSTANSVIDRLCKLDNEPNWRRWFVGSHFMMVSIEIFDKCLAQGYAEADKVVANENERPTRKAA